MPVRLDWVIVRLVGEVEPIETLPLATVPPVGRDCAKDGCAQPKPHNSAIKLTEVRNFLAQDVTADDRHAVDETIIEIPSAYRQRPCQLPASANSLSDMQWFYAHAAKFHATI